MTSHDAQAREGIPARSREAVPTRAIVFLSIAAFASAATTRICDGMLPQISTDFAVTAGAAAQVITAYSASYGLLQIATGLLGDRFGKARVLLIAAIASLFTTLACAAATTLTDLIWARLFAGAAASGIVPLSLAWLGDNISYDIRQGVIARFISGQIGGVVFGLAFGGVIGEAFGWRTAFWLIAALYVVATTGLLLQFGSAARARAEAAPTAGSFASLAAVLRRRWARVVLLATFAEGFLCFGALAYVTSMLHLRFGMGFAAAGLTLSAFGVGGLLFSFMAPRIVRRFGEPGGARLASILFALAFLGYALMPWAWIAVPSSFLAGLAYYALHNVLQVNATQMAPDARGVAVALFASAAFLGQGLGVAVAAPVVDLYGAQPVFLVAALLLPCCAILFARAIDRRGAQMHG